MYKLVDNKLSLIMSIGMHSGDGIFSNSYNFYETFMKRSNCDCKKIVRISLINYQSSSTSPNVEKKGTEYHQILVCYLIPKRYDIKECASRDIY